MLRSVSLMKEETKDPVELQLALRVCRGDLTKAQEELTRMKAEYWDVVPRRNWDTLEQTHKQTLLQVAHSTLAYNSESGRIQYLNLKHL